MEVSGQPYTPATLPSGIDPQIPIELEAGWAPELVWMFLDNRKSLAPARI